MDRPQLARFPFAFVVTYGRSGSTLLQAILNSIPGYCVRGENYSVLFHLFVAAQHVEETRRTFGRQETTPSASWFGADRLDPEVFSGRLVDTFLDTCLQPSADTRCIGFKEIRYLESDIPDEMFPEYLSFIQSAFPGSALIFNVRNVVDTAMSGWWQDKDPKIVQTQLSMAIERFESYASDHSNCFLFSYDSLMERPGYCKGLFDFLGEPFDLDPLEKLLARRHGYETSPRKVDVAQSSTIPFAGCTALNIEAARIANLRRRIDDFRQRLRSAERALSRLQQELKESKKETRRAKRECSELTKSITALRHSTSWRLTSPLRGLRRIQRNWLNKS